MEQIFQSGTALPFPVVKRRRRPEKIIQPPDPILKLPPRGEGPVHIATLIKPLQEIINHPQRERLLAEFFQQEDRGQCIF